MRTHLRGADSALCKEPGATDRMTLDITQCDCRKCLWSLARTTMLQLTGTIGQLQRIGDTTVEVIPANDPRVPPRKG